MESEKGKYIFEKAVGNRWDHPSTLRTNPPDALFRER